MPKKAFFNLKDNKREKVINACKLEMASKDLDDIKISSIVRNANIPRGSFYYYFEDAEDMYLYIAEQAFEAKKNFYYSKMDLHPSKEFLDLFINFLDAAESFLEEDSLDFKIGIKIQNSSNKKVQRLFEEKGQVIELIIAELLEREKEKGLLKADIDITYLAKLFISISQENVYMALLENKFTKEHIVNLVKILKHGIYR